MNAMDFSILKSTVAPLSGLILLSLLSSVTLADTPSPESFTRRSELVLTLSDQWLIPSSSNNHLAPATDSNTGQVAVNNKKRPVDVGCGMDVSPFVTYDNSLGNRLEGECNLDYRY